MEQRDQDRAWRWMSGILAGLEVGVLGGLVMLGWFALDSMWHAQRWYAVPNLLGSTFYGNLAFRSGAGRATVSGIALHLCASGALGAAFGLVAPRGQSPLRYLLLGVATGLIWYYLLFGAFWRFVNPLIPLYSSAREMVVAHALFGFCLSRWPGAERSLRRGPSG
jgi:hypothetical protein